MTESDDTLLKNLLSEIEQLGVVELRKYFKDLYGFETRHSNRDMLKRRIAYSLQERRLGGLSKSDAEFLDKLAENDSLANLGVPVTAYRRGMQIVPGTKFTREWHGNTYEVIFRGRGKYEYCGKFYRSLTAVSCLITGSHWSGTTFFGVRDND